MKLGRAWGGLLIAVLALLASCGGGGPSDRAEDGRDGLVMAVVPAEDNAEMLRAYQPVADALAERLGMDVELFAATDYSPVIEAMRAERVDVANFGAFSYVLAARVADAAAIVVPTDEAGKQPHYKSTIITRPDSGIENLGDLRGKTLAFVDPTSTSGYLYPRKGLVEAGLDPDKDLGRTTFAGGHDAVALAVKNGTVDAGAVADVLHARMVRGGIISRGDTEIIWESEPIPGDPVAVRADLPPDLKRRIRDSFLSMTPEQVGGPLGITGAVGYVEVSDEDYDGIRDLVRTLDLDLDALADE